MGRLLAMGLCLLVAAGCKLDREDALRDELAGWLSVAEVLEFRSRSTCTGAVLRLKDAVISDRLTKATSVETAVQYLRAGRAVAFVLVDATPNEVSERIMTASLEQGLGLLSNGLGAAKRCLSDRGGMAFYAAIMSPDAVMIYDPGGNSLTLVHRQSTVPLAIFLRGNV